MVSFPRWTSQLPDGKLAILTYFLCRKDSALKLLEFILILLMDLPFFHIMLLTNLPYRNSQNTLSNVIHSYTELVLMKKLNS